MSPSYTLFVFLSSGFCLVFAFVFGVCFVCLEFQIIRFVISSFTPLVFIEISFVHPPPQVPVDAATFFTTPSAHFAKTMSVMISSSILETIGELTEATLSEENFKRNQSIVVTGREGGGGLT